MAWLITILLLILPRLTQGEEAAAPLRTVRSVLNLSPQEADLARPVTLEATVTLLDRKMELFFVQDDTGGIYVYAPQLPGMPRPGQSIAIQGFTIPGRFSPVVQLDSCRELGNPGLPAPRKSSIERVLSGIEDSQWIELEGVVRSAGSTDGRHRATLALGPNQVELVLCEATPGWEARLVDAQVQVRGVGGVQYGRKGEVSGFQL